MAVDRASAPPASDSHPIIVEAESVLKCTSTLRVAREHLALHARIRRRGDFAYNSNIHPCVRTRSTLRISSDSLIGDSGAVQLVGLFPLTALVRFQNACSLVHCGQCHLHHLWRHY